jgi:DNA-binding protein H-NS
MEREFNNRAGFTSKDDSLPKRLTDASIGAVKTGPAKGGKVAVKYKHGSDTWTGRGRTPRWLVALEKDGRKREEFRV